MKALSIKKIRELIDRDICIFDKKDKLVIKTLEQAMIIASSETLKLNQ